jgi:hypothetical protein
MAGKSMHGQPLEPSAGSDDGSRGNDRASRGNDRASRGSARTFVGRRSVFHRLHFFFRCKRARFAGKAIIPPPVVIFLPLEARTPAVEASTLPPVTAIEARLMVNSRVSR